MYSMQKFPEKGRFTDISCNYMVLEHSNFKEVRDENLLFRRLDENFIFSSQFSEAFFKCDHDKYFKMWFEKRQWVRNGNGDVSARIEKLVF